MAAGGQCDKQTIIEAIVDELSDKWGLSPSPVEVAVEAALPFWDESGIFVMSRILKSDHCPGKSNHFH